jgi:hypothetical protein
VDFVNRLHSDVSPSDGDTGYPFVYRRRMRKREGENWWYCDVN